MSTTYIIKPPRTNRRDSMRMCETLEARFARITRDTGRTIGGLFREVEDGGQNDQALEVSTPRETTTLSGQRTGQSRHSVSRSQVAVDRVIRRVRAEDTEKLAEIDERIAGVKEQLRALKTERIDAGQAAWKRAEKVPLREIVDLIPGV